MKKDFTLNHGLTRQIKTRSFNDHLVLIEATNHRENIYSGNVVLYNTGRPAPTLVRRPNSMTLLAKFGPRVRVGLFVSTPLSRFLCAIRLLAKRRSRTVRRRAKAPPTTGRLRTNRHTSSGNGRNRSAAVSFGEKRIKVSM